MAFNKRRIYYIKKEFQLRFIFRFVAIATAWAAVTVIFFVYFAGKKLDDLRYSSHFDTTSVNELLLPIMLGAQGLSLLIFAGLLAYTIHSLWHKLAHPIHDIKKSLNRVAAGDLVHEITLRKTDEFRDMASDLDEMRSALREKFVAIKEHERIVSCRADDLIGSILERDPSLSYAASLQSAVERMKESVKAFHYPE